jgi:SOS-response transcriptional repressor LexA
VQPSSSTQAEEDLVLEKVKDSEQSLSKKLFRLQNFIQKRVDSVDNNTSFLLKHQQISIESVTRRIKNLEKIFNQAIETSNEVDLDALSDKEKMVLLENKKRKIEILNMLNA